VEGMVPPGSIPAYMARTARDVARCGSAQIGTHGDRSISFARPLGPYLRHAEARDKTARCLEARRWLTWISGAGTKPARRCLAPITRRVVGGGRWIHGQRSVPSRPRPW